MNLKVAPCTREAAGYAVEHWHYSHILPYGRSAHWGVWEDDQFVGTVILGYGASLWLGASYGLSNGQIVELTRVALTTHTAPVSQIVSEVFRQFKATNPHTRLIASFADPVQDHHGGIYQAMNFIYTGESSPTIMFTVNGRTMHTRSVGALMKRHRRPTDDNRPWIDWLRTEVDPNAETFTAPGKYRYLYPLDRGMRRQIEKLRQPYPAPLARA